VQDRADSSLAGRVILVTRPADRGEELVRLLGGRGAVVEQRPTIALVPPSDPEPATRVLGRLESFDWILFTSSNGVRFFFQALAATGVALLGTKARMAAIGPATARELEAHGSSASLVARDSRAEGLAEALHEQVRSGERVLLVRPEETRPFLQQRLAQFGLRVEDVPFYRNVAAPGLPEIARDVVDGRYHAIVFTAPSTLRRLLRGAGERSAELREALDRLPLVAIGPLTAEAIVEEGLDAAAVAAEPSDTGLARALDGIFGG
jgi:uroporphyrinogen-III synthase